METIDDVIQKKTSKSLLTYMRLVDPQCKFGFTAELIDAWNGLSLTDQRKLYLYLLYRRWRGIDIYGEPYYIIRNCHPVPFNWNEHALCKTLIAEHKVTIAKWNGNFGTYTRDEAMLYEMTDKRLFN